MPVANNNNIVMACLSFFLWISSAEAVSNIFIILYVYFT